jgi:pyrophosphatase PpaX
MNHAVVFDVDGVLINSFKANHKFFENLFTQFGYTPPTIEEYKDLFPKSMMDVIQIVTKSTSEEEVKKIWEVGKERDGLYPYELINSPEAMEEIIERLANKFILGVVTSRIRGGVFDIPQLINIEKYFNTAVYYEDTEKHKPDPEPLLLVSRRLDMDPSDVVYIGDAKSDVDSAKAANMKMILYKDENTFGVENWTNNFAELPDLVEKLWI